MKRIRKRTENWSTYELNLGSRIVLTPIFVHFRCFDAPSITREIMLRATWPICFYVGWSIGMSPFWCFRILSFCKPFANLYAFCQAASLLPICKPFANLQAFFQYATLLAFYQTFVSLQALCQSASLLSFCKSFVSLQVLCQSASLLPNCKPFAKLQGFC